LPRVRRATADAILSDFYGSRTTEINRMLGGLIAALQEKQNGSEQTQSPEN
jgi:hypothetical protein